MFLIFCEVNTISLDVTVDVTKDQIPMLADLPHIRIDRYVSDNRTILRLVIENMAQNLIGTYQCAARDEMSSAVGEEVTILGKY